MTFNHLTPAAATQLRADSDRVLAACDAGMLKVLTVQAPEPEPRRIKVGDRVRTGCYVCGEWRPSSPGIVVSQSFDGTVSHVDVMSLHGGRPWVRAEITCQLRLEPEPIPVGEATESDWGALEQAQAEPLRRHFEDSHEEPR